MPHRQANRAVFYHRDSSGSHEMTPAEYIRWAQKKSKELGVDFRGTPGQIDAMMRSGVFAEGDIYFDFGVAGNLMSRPGLDRLLTMLQADRTISHLLIPRRDRLARPDDPIDGMKLENGIRQGGVALVFQDHVLPPLGRGRRDFGEQLAAYIAYEASGKFRRDHAQKMLNAQLALARNGFSPGGRPPFGFRRWLVGPDGTPERELLPGEVVRRAGYHVVWLPGAEEEISLIRRILEMLKTQRASRVAAQLTAEGIPSPDAGRTRKDNGVVHPVSGDWHATTITNIARNALIIGVYSYGRRSMGDQLRFSPEGPRELQDADFRAINGKPKVIRNPESQQIKAAAHGEPLVDVAEHQKLLAELDVRGGSQRGKPRSSDPDRNPLGCRVYDLDCGWPMYRAPYKESFRYTCGLYQQSHGQKCEHNHVPGPQAAKFLVGCLRQRVLAPERLAKLKRRLHELAEAEKTQQHVAAPDIQRDQALLAVEAKLEVVQRNLAFAETPEQFKAISRTFDELTRQHAELRRQIAAQPRESTIQWNAQREVEAALLLFDRLGEWSEDEENYPAMAQAFNQVNARLFLKFAPVPTGKRILNRLVSGIVTFGESPPPVPLYEGPTSRKSVKTNEKSPAKASSPGSVQVGPDQEGGSLGNVSRSGGTPLELFVRQLSSWPSRLVDQVAAIGV